VSSDSKNIEVDEFPLVVFTWKDMTDPGNKDKWVETFVDLEKYSRIFVAIEERYPENKDDPVADYDALGVRVDQYREAINEIGKENDKSIPPQTEGNVLWFVGKVKRMQWDRVPEDIKKKLAIQGDQSGSGGENSNSAPSPSEPSSAAT
jgi:hypothetical protein